MFLTPISQMRKLGAREGAVSVTSSVIYQDSASDSLSSALSGFPPPATLPQDALFYTHFTDEAEAQERQCL